MNRPASRRLASLALAALLAATLGGCVSPFSDHASDVHDAFAKKARDAHRKWWGIDPPALETPGSPPVP